MLPDPTHPCAGCIHRKHHAVRKNPRTRRDAPTCICTGGGPYTPIFWGDPLPKWCPGKAVK